MVNEKMHPKLVELHLLLDHETRMHTFRVREIAVKIGILMGLRDEELFHLGNAAQFHDIGKIAIHPHILMQRRALSETERQQIRQHPEIGAEIWRFFGGSPAVARAIISHHEHYDGHGYPYGLTGPDIPMWGRIIAVADALDAMLSERPYSKSMNIEKASLLLLQASGSQFDPYIIRRLLKSEKSRYPVLPAVRANYAHH